MELPKRKQIRLKDYDYSQNGYYFITICTHNRLHLFGTVIDGKMVLNQYGEIVNKNLSVLSEYKNEIDVKSFCIMPNHIHFVLSVCRERIVCVQNNDRTKMEIPKIIQQFKSSITKQCNLIDNGSGTHTMRSLQWQKSYYEHIIRNEQEYQRIYDYIENNPQKWEEDKYYEQ